MFNSFNFKLNKQVVLLTAEEPFLNIYINELTNHYLKSLKDFHNKLKDIQENKFVNLDNFNKIKEITFQNIKIINIIKKYLNKKSFDINYDYPIKDDLHFNKLSLYNSNEIINIKDSFNKRYWSFYYKDLISIIKTSLNNNEDNFPNPLVPKNPYTNQNFTISNLYKIYSILNNYDLPLELILYYKNNFNRRIMLSNHWMYFVKKACQNYIRNMNDIEFLNELKYNLSNYLKHRQYDWNKIENDKNARDNFEKLLIKINLSDNCYFNEKEIKDIKNELLTIINNNFYRRSILKSKRSFVIESSFNYINRNLNHEMNDNYMEDGIFMFGGNQRYREIRSVLTEIIDQIENENNNQIENENNNQIENENNNQNVFVSLPENIQSSDNLNNLSFSIGSNTNRNLSRRNRLERRRRRRMNRTVNRRNVVLSTYNHFQDNNSENNSESEIIEDTIYYENDNTNLQENYDFNSELNGLIVNLQLGDE